MKLPELPNVDFPERCAFRMLTDKEAVEHMLANYGRTTDFADHVKTIDGLIPGESSYATYWSKEEGKEEVSVQNLFAFGGFKVEPGTRSFVYLLTLANVLEDEKLKFAKLLQKTLVKMMDKILEGFGFGNRVVSEYTELDDVDEFVLDGTGKRLAINAIKNAIRSGCIDQPTFIEVLVETSNREHENAIVPLSEAVFNERTRVTIEFIKSVWDETVTAVAAEDEEAERRAQIRQQIVEEKQRAREERERKAREEREREEAAAAAKAKQEEEKRLFNDQIERVRHKMEKNLRNILAQQQRETEKQARQREWLEKHPRKNGNKI